MTGIRNSIFQGWKDRLLSRPAAESGGVRGRLWRLAQVFYFGYIEFFHKLCWERAGTLSFVTVISLIPLSVLFLSFVGLFWQGEELQSFVQGKLLVYMVPDAKIRDSLWGLLKDEIKSTAFEFKPGVNLLAILGLFASAAALLVTAERVFNRLWELPVTRSYLQKLEIFWIILTTSPIALGVSLYFDQLTSTGTVIGSLKERYWMLGALYSFLLPALISFTAFTILIFFLPNTRVRFGPAVLGAFITSVLWEGAKKGFYLYLREAQNLSRFYGTLGILPVLLVWIYVTWCIILLGVVIARSAQDRRRLVLAYRRHPTQDPGPTPALLAVSLLEQVYRGFHACRPLQTLVELAEALQVPASQLESVARALVDRGFLVEAGKDEERLAPARPAGLVRVREIVEIFPDRAPESSERPHLAKPGRSLAEVLLGAREAYLGALGPISFEEIVGKPVEATV